MSVRMPNPSFYNSSVTFATASSNDTSKIKELITGHKKTGLGY